MKPTDYLKLENDIVFKKSYLNRTLWWKSILLIAPTSLLFAGLVGIMYLFNNGMLVSWYVIPYLVFFVLGTVWLKAVRLHIRKSKMAAEGAFHICMAKPVGEKEGYVYTVFMNTNKRHNGHQISKLAETLPADELLTYATAKKCSIEMHDEVSDTDFYLRAFAKGDICKSNAAIVGDEPFPVLFIDEKYTLVVKGRDL